MLKMSGYRLFVLSVLKCPDFVFKMIFALIYPIYAFLHRKSACKRVQNHLLQTGFSNHISVRDIFYNLFFNALDSVRYLSRDQKTLSRVRYENEFLIQNALSQGMPVVAMSIHQGAFEILHRSLCRYSNQVHLISETFPDKALTQTIRKLRTDPHLKEYHTSEISIIFKKFLREKGILALLVDQAKTTKGNGITLFKKKTLVYLRLPLEANRLGAAIITFRTFREPSGNHVIRFENCYMPKTEPQILIDHFSQEAENWITQHPEQWAWNYYKLFNF